MKHFNLHLILPYIFYLFLFMGISVAAQIPDAVTIDTLGNVGIGTSRPSEKLEVKGRIKDTTGFVMPSGGIIMWSGALNKIPQGWALCNGQNGTPDLQDKFIVGAGQKYAVQQTGGLDAVTLLENQMPVHTHQGGSDSQQSFLNYEGVLWNSKGVQARGIVIYNGRGLPGNRPNAANTYNLPNPETNQHSHAISVANSGGGLAHENRPPYMALCYIMKL